MANTLTIIPKIFQKDKNISELHAEYDHPSEVIIRAIVRALNLTLNNAFKDCEEFA